MNLTEQKLLAFNTTARRPRKYRPWGCWLVSALLLSTFSANSTAQAPGFVRGDVNLDGQIDISDATTIIRHLHHSTSPLACDDAADANDDGLIDLSDAVYILSHLFWGGDAPPAPLASPGQDPTEDLLTCAIIDNENECAIGDDCESGVCEQGACQAASCFDQVRNGDETAVDCGGESCQAPTPVTRQYATGHAPSDAQLGDIDEDGDLDLVVQNDGGCLNGREEQRTIWESVPIYGGYYYNPWTGEEGYQIIGYQRRAAGFELVWRCLEEAPPHITVYENDGDGVFSNHENVGEGTSAHHAVLAGEAAQSLSASDLDGNGVADEITLDQEGNAITVILHGLCPTADGDAAP